MNTQAPPSRRRRGSLTGEEILDAAEHVASVDPDSVTIRAVAAQLGSSPMALYRYFPTKDDLVDALIDRVVSRVPIPGESEGDWAERLRLLAVAHGRTLLDHPWAVPALFSSPSPGVGAARLGEAYLAILADGGLRGNGAVAAFGAVLALNYGRTAFAASAPGEELPALPAAHFPHSAANASALADYASDATYERALDLLLAGIRAEALGARASID